MIMKIMIIIIIMMILCEGFIRQKYCNKNCFDDITNRNLEEMSIYMKLI